MAQDLEWPSILTAPGFGCVCICHSVSVCMVDHVCMDQSVILNVYN